MNTPDMIERIKSIKSRIEMLIQDGHLSGAETLLDQLCENLPEDTDVCSMRAVILIMRNELDTAESVLLEGLEKDSVNFDLIFNLAYISELRGQFQQAADQYLKASSAAVSDEQRQSVSQAIDKLKAIDGNITIQERLKIVFFVQEGMDTFLRGVIQGLDKEYWVRKVIVRELCQVDEGMRWADICWFEWCDELAIYGSNLPMANYKKIICRLHSYEAFTDYPGKVRWENVDRIVFVAPHIKDIVLENVSEIKAGSTIVIPNGIDMNKHLFSCRTPGYNIAYVGYINYKKGPMLLLQTFKAIFEKDCRYRLYIAGKFQEARDKLYFKQMVKELGIQDNVFFQGWQGNVNEWLKDKNYIISTSLLEGNPVGIMEAMAQGIKPIIHNFVGAKSGFPVKYIWNTIDEAVNMVISKEYESGEYHDFIENNYSLEKEIQSIKKLIDDELIKSTNDGTKIYNIETKRHNGKTNTPEENRQDPQNPVINYYNNFLVHLQHDRERTNPRHVYLKKSLGSIIKPGDKVLDLGCGIGITTEYIKSLGVSKVIGVDLSPKLIEYAKSTVDGVKFLVHDITTLELNEEFDKVVLCDVVEHVPLDKYNDLFRTISKHLKKQGIVYMSIPDPRYQDFVRQNRPNMLQIIDNSIPYGLIEQLCRDNRLFIKFFNVYGIDFDNQYNEYLLCDQGDFLGAWDALLGK